MTTILIIFTILISVADLILLPFVLHRAIKNLKQSES